MWNHRGGPPPTMWQSHYFPVLHATLSSLGLVSLRGREGEEGSHRGVGTCRRAAGKDTKAWFKLLTKVPAYGTHQDRFCTRDMASTPPCGRGLLCPGTVSTGCQPRRHGTSPPRKHVGNHWTRMSLGSADCTPSPAGSPGQPPDPA